MSDVKPTEITDIPAPVVVPTEPVVAEPVAEAKTETEAPVATETAPEEPTTAEPAAAEAEATPETPADAPVEAAPKEVEPITEGTLETKLLSVFPIFLKKYIFYFNDEAISEDHLVDYSKKEKTKASHANHAHATQTGKGLLFYTKSDKTKPFGIILIDGAEVTTQGDKKFTIKSAGHELQLEAATATLRERWVHTLKLKAAECEGVHATIAETEGYKAVLERLTTKPTPVAAAHKEKKEEVEEPKEGEKEEDEDDKKAKKAAKKEQKKKDKEEKKAAGEPVEDSSSSSSSEEEAGETSAAAAEAEKKEEKKDEKKEKRSASKTRNRFSFFGGKKEKEEKKEEKKDEEAPAPVAEAPEETATTVPEVPVVAEPTPAVIEPAPVAEVPVTTEPPTDTPKEGEEPKTETSPATSPKTNRKSFLSLFKKEKKVDAPPAEEAAKSPDPVPEVAETAEVEPLATTSEPQTADHPLPDAGETEAVAVEPPSTEAPKDTKENEHAVESPRDRKSGFFSSLRREKSTDGSEDKVKRSLSFWKKEKKAAGKDESPAALAESDPAAEGTATEPLKTDPAATEAIPAPLPDTTAGAPETEVVDGKIGDVVPAAVTVGGESSKA
ncbi:hypothetical protein Dda_5090 [Drechslerella dactyloides]|uniref:PH domain-containing protein n=1 Tax=Drechslerella dactyloides TaxID=74499 RepID=A0AAD6IVM4_DREDA|nr:hypothetical protein Dda_5090 [Drechslerella dactyloides]